MSINGLAALAIRRATERASLNAADKILQIMAFAIAIYIKKEEIIMQLKVKYLFDNLPELVSDPLDSGFDVRAAVDHPVKIEPMGRETIPTGIAVEIDPLYGLNCHSVELQVRPRSGHTMRGIVAQFGTIDRGYRGEISITVFNFNNHEVEIQPLERIAQLVVCPIFKPEPIKVKVLSETKRGTNGFGSSGIK